VHSKRIKEVEKVKTETKGSTMSRSGIDSHTIDRIALCSTYAHSSLRVLHTIQQGICTRTCQNEPYFMDLHQGIKQQVLITMIPVTNHLCMEIASASLHTQFCRANHASWPRLGCTSTLWHVRLVSPILLSLPQGSSPARFQLLLQQNRKIKKIHNEHSPFYSPVSFACFSTTTHTSSYVTYENTPLEAKCSRIRFILLRHDLTCFHTVQACLAKLGVHTTHPTSNYF
jgi:hypothetical protein